MIRKTLYIAIALFWLASMGMLSIRYHAFDALAGSAGGAAPMENILPDIPDLNTEQWMGIYMGGEKIGYSVTVLKPAGDGYRFINTTKLILKVMGMEKEIRSTVDAGMDKELALVSFVADVAADIPLRISGKVKDRRLVLEMETAGGRQSRTIEIDRVPTFEGALLRGLLREGLKMGSSISMPVLDPATLGISEMVLEVAGRETILSMGREVPAYRLKGTAGGIQFSVWVDEDGDVLKEESPGGFVLLKESKEEAMAIGKPPADLIAGVSVPFDMELKRGVRHLKVKFSGIEPEGLDLDGGSQRLMGDVIEITSSLPPRQESLEDRARLKYLAPTMTIQSEDPAIVALASGITRAEKDEMEKARLINQWVHENLKKEPTLSIPSATDVLTAGRGDCNEHTVLYAALARAAAIPARIAVGLLYVDGPEGSGGAFYYHAWPEVYISGGWLPVDPTIGEFPADASHIRLLNGDLSEQARLLNVMGRLGLSGIEASND